MKIKIGDFCIWTYTKDFSSNNISCFRWNKYFNNAVFINTIILKRDGYKSELITELLS